MQIVSIGILFSGKNIVNIYSAEDAYKVVTVNP